MKKNSPLTMPEIVAAVNSVVKRSERSIRSDVVALGLRPVGKRQRPQRYHHTTPAQIVRALGYETALMQTPNGKAKR